LTSSPRVLALLQVICLVCDAEQPVSIWHETDGDADDFLIQVVRNFLFFVNFCSCFSGCAGVLQLRSLHGGVLLHDVQVLRR
jgi:hypothetical protein